MKLIKLNLIKQNVRWVWVTFFVFVALPLYAIAITLLIRSGLFTLNGGSLSNDQLKAVWTFLAAGVAASATILGALLTKSYNDKSLASQNLNTVVSALGLISKNGQYSTGAATAAGGATLVQLGHPIVAMRALRPAFMDKAVGRDTFTWLISQVLTSKATVGTPRDLQDAREEAAMLLREFSGKLTDHDGTDYSWPNALAAQWPSGLSVNTAWNLMYAIANLLTSESKEWWNQGGGTYTWVIFTLDEALQRDSNSDIKAMAADLGLCLMEATDEYYLSGLNNAREKSEVAKRMTSTKVGSQGRTFDQSLREKIQTWGSIGSPF